MLAQTQDAQEEIFSTKGNLVEVNPEEKLLRLKNEGGLELTFRVVATTQVWVEEAQKLLADLPVNGKVEIEYNYNENYEKVARLIKVQKEPASPA